MVDLVLPFLAQKVAHLVKDGSRDGVEEVMALHVEIGGLWGNAQSLEFFFQLKVGLLVARVLALQLVYLKT